MLKAIRNDDQARSRSPWFIVRHANHCARPSPNRRDVTSMPTSRSDVSYFIFGEISQDFEKNRTLLRKQMVANKVVLFYVSVAVGPQFTDVGKYWIYGFVGR